MGFFLNSLQQEFDYEYPLSISCTDGYTQAKFKCQYLYKSVATCLKYGLIHFDVQNQNCENDDWNNWVHL